MIVKLQAPASSAATQKVLILVSTLLLFLAVLLPGANLFGQSVQFQRGDPNGDTNFDISDAISILGFIFRGIPERLPCEDAADTNDDGQLDLADAVSSLEIIFRGGLNPPAPYLSCGLDPTEDTLGCESSGCPAGPSTEFPGVRVQLEMLAFDDQLDFESTMRRIRLDEASDEERQESVNDLADQVCPVSTGCERPDPSRLPGAELDFFEEKVGFFSMRSQRIQKEEDGQSDLEESFIASDYLLTLLNPHGEIMIGDRIFVVSSQQTYEIPDGDFQALLEIRDGNVPEGVIVHKSANDDCKGNKSCNSGWVLYGDGNRRLRGKIWIRNLPFYAEAGGSTKHQQRINGNWKSRNADIIEVAGQFVATDKDCNNPGSVDFWEGQNNKKKAKWSISWWNQVTKVESFTSAHAVSDDGYSYVFTLDLFNCTAPPPGVTPPPPPPPPTAPPQQSLVLSHDSGLFAVSQNGDLERFYWASGAWQNQTIPHWGNPLVPGSMIQGASGETIYGVNTAGKIFTTWKDAGVITFALINPPGGVNVHSNSLVLSHDSGLFAVSQNGDLERFYWASGAWQKQTIPHWGNPLVPGSMIQGASGETIYGVNTAGKIFITWKDAGVITFALINPPGGVNVYSNSLVLSHDSGLFAVSQNGDLDRFYWASGAWQNQTIPHWGAPLVPGSMIQGASGETIYGVNTAGKIFTTWKDAGVITFALIP